MGGEYEVEKDVVPTFSWQQMLSKLARESEAEPEETYQKASKDAVRAVHAVAQMGAGALKPGEVINEDTVKLAVFIDTSGSMNVAIAKVFANLKKLLKGRDIGKDMYIVKFSDAHVIYKANLKKGSAVELSSIKDKSGKTEKIEDVLSRASGGGTVFSGGMVDLMDELVKMKFNILIISDSDILTANYQKVVLKHKQRVYTIFASKSDFLAAVTFLGVNVKSLTYLDE
jgi:hypothetical protein